jgi:FkbM family methyltransferase
MTETEIKLRHPDGRQIAFRMDLDPCFVSDQHVAQYVDRQACYEPDVAWVLMRALRLGDNCVDVGACVGFFTLLMSQLVGEHGEVVAVEPGVDNLLRLNRNLSLAANMFTPGDCNVTVIEQPLSARADQVRFYHNADSSGGHALWDPAKWHENEKTKNLVQGMCDVRDATTLNRITPKPCRLIKIDTEGAEEKILQGAHLVLCCDQRERPPFVVAEMNDFGLRQMGDSPDSLRALMRLFGYDTFMLYMDGAVPELVPPRKSIECDHIYNVLFSTPDDVASIWQ